jgi:hypothetical protein
MKTGIVGGMAVPPLPAVVFEGEGRSDGVKLAVSNALNLQSLEKGDRP